MAIIIRKKNVKDTQEPAPLVADATPAPVKASPEPTADERIKVWIDNHPPTDAEPKQCQWCKHWYITPCADTDKAKSCANYLHLRNRTERDNKETRDVQPQV
jgi:hypothetical protein